METCDTCGNEYDKPLTIEYRGDTYNFDCFECAIQQLAPECHNCGSRIIGHGVETDSANSIYCCAHCAKADGHPEFVDRAG